MTDKYTDALLEDLVQGIVGALEPLSMEAREEFIHKLRCHVCLYCGDHAPCPCMQDD